MADHHEALNDFLRNALKGTEEDLVEYFSGILAEALEEGNISSLKDMKNTFSELWLSYGIFDNENVIHEACVNIYEDLKVSKILEEFESVESQKRKHLLEGATVMAKYYEDEEMYEAVIDEIDENGDFYVTFTEYGNQELVTLDDIHTLQKIVKDESLMNAPVKVSAEDFDEEGQNLINSVMFKKNRCRTDFIGSDLDKDGIDILKTRKQKKEIKKKRAKLARYDPSNYAKILKQTIQEEWFDVSFKNRSRTVQIENYDLYTLDDSTKLLENVEIKLTEGKHYGLVGRNGCGKTTLLRRISRYDIEEFPKYIRVMHIEQEITGDHKTVIETVMAMDVVLESLREKELLCIKQEEEGDESAPMRLADVYRQRRELELDEESSAERAKVILKGLMFTEEMYDWPTTKLSGGWRMRVSLAGALFVKPDILMLDEPTNHLDFPAVVWLENYLKSYENTVLVVSHDREFLNNVVDTIIHQANDELKYYKGNFAQFISTREQGYQNQLSEYKAQQMQIEHIQSFIDRWRCNAKKAPMVQSRIKTIKNMVLIEEPTIDRGMVMEIPQTSELEDTVCVANEIVFGYDASKLLFKKVDFNLTMQSRIAVIGANGAGKSTLIKLILKELEVLFGSIETNRSCRITPFTQHHVDQLDLTKSPVDFLFNKFKKGLITEPRPDEIIRNALGRFGLSGDIVDRPMSTLSGGQKSRVAFTVMTWKTPNFIIMDEPTNHLDMETIDALIRALNAWRGGLLIVSHDQHFLQSVAKEYWIVAKKKIIRFTNFHDAKAFALEHHQVDL